MAFLCVILAIYGIKYRMNKNRIKSPLNYTGGKYRLLSQLLPLFPKNISTFVDLFTGGGTVALNVSSQKTYAIDNNYNIIKLLSLFQKLSYEELLGKVNELEKYYGLNRENKLGYLKLRDYFNSYQDPVALFTLICYSFNNMTRFNSKGQYNVPFGKRIFNENIRKNLKETISAIQSKEIIFAFSDYKEAFNLVNSQLDENSFVYCDPPYLITDAAYNSQQEFTKLLILLDQLNESGIKWGLSEVIFHKGKENDVLREWMDKYKVHYINSDYSNCNYQTSGTNVEVYVYNY